MFFLMFKFFKGRHATNLKHHISRVHPEKFAELLKSLKSQSPKIASKDDSAPTPSTSINNKSTCVQETRQLTLEEISKIRINLPKENLYNALVDLVTLNGRPFSIIEDSGLRKIVDPILNGLKIEKSKITPLTIKQMVQEEANEIKRTIALEVKDLLVSLKVDAVTRMDRSFLGINIQYIKESKIVLRTLGLIEIKQRHTGNSLFS